MTTLLSGTTITPADHAAWLDARRAGIGASECAAALGVCPYTTPLELYLRKTGLAPDVAENAAMRRGKALEASILAEYREWAGIGDGEMIEQVFLRHQEHPWMTATLDAVQVNTDGAPIVEAKAVGWRSARDWGEEGTDEIPWHYLCQVHHQLAVSGAEVCHVAALIGGSDFRVYQVARDEAVLAGMIPRLAEFWGRVERREPPGPTAADARLLHTLFPARDEAVELGEAEALAADRYEEIGRAIKRLEAERAEAKAGLVVALAGANRGLLPDGRSVKFTATDVAERTQTIRAHTRQDFRILKARD